eukprot:CAMPEP_0196662188 /NCGR_PEP_ID=MMETSP1086-20130531/47567_1 /TAXON_ID=77921 /ORGANISM="Cyanoptyche  gloeocystis , Strain SAG4.97" /LENGTH=61 /DNA_ID=CAMNT_0041997423 /DNA_START=73 /DNA_END=254 /DNA_ORIENTATION=+
MMKSMKNVDCEGTASASLSRVLLKFESMEEMFWLFWMSMMTEVAMKVRKTLMLMNRPNLAA